MAARKLATPKKQKPPRLYVHPEVEPIIWAGGAISPGQELPKKVPPATIREWWHARLIIREDMYKLYFSRLWNRNFPRDPVPNGVDVEPETGDSMADEVREV
jgi:hypothetical protein